MQQSSNPVYSPPVLILRPGPAPVPSGASRKLRLCCVGARNGRSYEDDYLRAVEEANVGDTAVRAQKWDEIFKVLKGRRTLVELMGKE